MHNTPEGYKCSLAACWSRLDASNLFVLHGENMTTFAVRTPGHSEPGLLYRNFPPLQHMCWSAPAEAVPLAAFPYAHVPVFATTVCLGPFVLDPATVLGR